MSRGTALVTGATNGIGWELAILLAEHGYDLLATGRDHARLRKLESELRGRASVKGLAADLSQEEGVETVIAAVRASGAVPEILVNNAGLGDRGPFVEADLERQRAIMDVNVVSLVRLTRELLPSMVQRGSGRILNVASTAAFLPGPLMSIYYASKAFVLSFSYALSLELRGSGVSVSILCPGPTRTEFAARAGTETARLHRVGVMEARAVAQAAVRGLLRGKRMIVPGLMNKITATLPRFAPRGLVAGVAMTMNSDR